MGALAKIEKGKNSSDAFGGCAPLDWLKEKASDFAGWVGRGIYDFGKKLAQKVLNFEWPDLKWLNEFAKNAIKNIPGIEGVQRTYGAMIAVGGKIAKASGEAAGCIKAALAGLGIVGAVAGGAAAISALGGLGAVLGGLAVVGFIGASARWLLRGVGRAYNFNFNITDKEIQQRYKESVRQISARLGGVVGTGLATLACGAAPGVAIATINPLALALVKEVNEDGWQEFKGQVQSLIQTTAAAAQQWLILESFKNIRSAIKKSAANGILGGVLPDKIKKKIEGWGAEGSKPWTFAEKVEEKIESIKNPNVKAFVEEAVEEFMDVCSEQLYALTYAF